MVPSSIIVCLILVVPSTKHEVWGQDKLSAYLIIHREQRYVGQ